MICCLLDMVWTIAVMNSQQLWLHASQHAHIDGLGVLQAPPLTKESLAVDSYREIDRERDKQTETDRQRQIETETEKVTERETDRQKETKRNGK